MKHAFMRDAAGLFHIIANFYGIYVGMVNLEAYVFDSLIIDAEVTLIMDSLRIRIRSSYGER
jgi:ubiquinone biosynthesis protein Coq4